MGHQCYCAFCAGNIGSAILVGSEKPKHLAKRRSRVEKWMKRPAGENVVDTDNDDEDLDETEDEDEVEAQLEDEDRSSDEDFDPKDSESCSDWDSEDESSDISDVNEDGAIEDVGTEELSSVWSSGGETSNRWFPYEEESQDPSFNHHEFEQRSYDPTLLDSDDVKWLRRNRCLAFNAEENAKAFISGRGKYDDFGRFDASKPSSDPNANNDDNWLCYTNFGLHVGICFPFHEECYEIFARCLFGTPDIRRIDKDALYTAMERALETHDRCFNVPRGCALDLYYGDIEGPDSYWKCIGGEEYAVIDPGRRRSVTVSEALQEILPAQLFTTPATMHSDITHKVLSDPFAQLPYDILHTIFPYLSDGNILDLMKASWSVNFTTRNNSIWKQLLHSRIYPWFWEAKEVLNGSTLPQDFNYKRAFLWLNTITTPKFGIRGPFIGVANRRRIWSVCEELKFFYRNSSPIDVSADLTNDEEAKDIMTRAASLQMSLVAHPKPRNLGKTVSTQWIKSWADVDSRSCVFETYWRSTGPEQGDSSPEAEVLIGMGVIFGLNDRRFNCPKDLSITWSCKTAMIDANDWIKEIILHVRNKGDRSQIRHAVEILPGESRSIEGVTVLLNSGIQHSFSSERDIAPMLGQRILIASDGHVIVGIAGQIGENLSIGRLGILQCARPSWEPSSTPSLAQTNRLLWAKQATEIPTPSTSPASIDTIPVWRHPTLSLSQFSGMTPLWNVPLQVLPHHILLWAHTPSAYRNLTAISACCVSIGIGSYDHHGRGPKYTAIRKDIIGLRAEYIHDSEPKFRDIGTGGPVPSMTDPQYTDLDNGEFAMHPDPTPEPWSPFNTERFKIDGRGGEVVTVVYVSFDARAIKLQTNRGRECYWGEQEGQEWMELRAEDGRVIVGLVVCFGKLGGYNWTSKAYSHWRTAAVCAVTMPVGDDY